MGITDPESIWGKAGLHTGDEILSINDTPVVTQKTFFDMIRKADIGEIISIEVKRVPGIFKADVLISGYKTASVKISELTTATEEQQKLRWHWLAGN